MQTSINGWTIKLHQRDQYNDYSVIYDYSIEVCEPGQAYGRSWNIGTNKHKASQAYNLAIRTVQQHVN